VAAEEAEHIATEAWKKAQKAKVEQKVRWKEKAVMLAAVKEAITKAVEVGKEHTRKVAKEAEVKAAREADLEELAQMQVIEVSD